MKSRRKYNSGDLVILSNDIPVAPAPGLSNNSSDSDDEDAEKDMGEFVLSCNPCGISVSGMSTHNIGIYVVNKVFSGKAGLTLYSNNLRLSERTGMTFDAPVTVCKREPISDCCAYASHYNCTFPVDVYN